MIDHALLEDLSDRERFMFQNEFNSRRKDVTTAVLLALFLGGGGAHKFYMGRTSIGVVYLLFFWTLIPAIVALVETFLMPGRVRKHNAESARQIALEIKALRPG